MNDEINIYVPGVDGIIRISVYDTATARTMFNYLKAKGIRCDLITRTEDVEYSE